MNPARRSAFPVRLAPLALLLGAVLLAGQEARAAAPKAPPATSAAPTRVSAAEQAAMTRGRTLVQDFYAVKLDGLWRAFSPGVRAQWGTLTDFQAFRRGGLAQYGPERQVVQERTFTRGRDTDSVCFADRSEHHRSASSTSGTRFSPTRSARIERALQPIQSESV
ncbi:hypothetical protein [Deinococcus sp. RIT780]|uniref:hypothetical protein n=1 Tax=Deinococcus sp. RIT780 TaxID=2870472 RepID=UPI001C892B71|nr:hypothetical protein [Deinococcus sp. RIT780]MBX8463927.1 hypothetical protein [Deinococcus sp. RIT780]